MEIYILIIIVTAVITGIVVYALTRFLDDEWNRKWTLSVIRDGQIGWMPILERHLNDKSWEYIYINEENLALIMTCPPRTGPVFMLGYGHKTGPSRRSG
jgi:hypothetical protein